MLKKDAQTAYVGVRDMSVNATSQFGGLVLELQKHVYRHIQTINNRDATKIVVYRAVHDTCISQSRCIVSYYPG